PANNNIRAGRVSLLVLRIVQIEKPLSIRRRAWNAILSVVTDPPLGFGPFAPRADTPYFRPARVARMEVYPGAIRRVAGRVRRIQLLSEAPIAAAVEISGKDTDTVAAVS